MENLKIKVNSETESREAQELFLKYGATGNMCLDQSIRYVCTFNGALTLYDFLPSIEFKRITLPQLRDLVVLKRNDRKDANVSEENCLYDLYLTESKELYFYGFGKNKWILSKLNGDDIYYESLKPIEKPMKEYLIKSGDGKYLLTHHDSIGAIEIPEGANFAWKSDGKYVFFTALEMGYRDAAVVWQRHTHPEELPFIDDEPKIETATGYQLDVVGSNTYGSRSRYDGESDISYRQYLMNFIVGNGTESINNQYAEIEKVRQSHRTASETSNPTIKETLNQRQSQYGSFEDVAMITEQMVDVMRKGYYENLAYNQKMALYMICSKMARIVNGNPNHKDSWHDIAGYATLIDNELVSEKDMPF